MGLSVSVSHLPRVSLPGARWFLVVHCPLQALGERRRFTFTITPTAKENKFLSKTLLKMTEACAYGSFLVHISYIKGGARKAADEDNSLIVLLGCEPCEL